VDIEEDKTGLFRFIITALVGLTALVFFTYGPSLTFGFLVNSDDQAYIYRNPYLHDISLSNLRAIFTNIHFNAYLPMNLASYSLDYTIWKVHSFGYHLTQLVLHVANSCMILIMLLLSRFPKMTALGTAFIYSVHPVHAESVVWIAERKNLLSAFFIFLSLICYIHYGRQNSGKYYSASLALFVLALLSKSIAVILPVIFILHDLCISGRGWRLGEKIPFFIGSLAVALATVYIAEETNKVYPGGSLPVTALYMLRIYWDYIFSLAFPFSLSPEYHYVKTDFREWQSLLAYAVVPATIILALARYRTRPISAFLTGWFLLWILPVSNIIAIPTMRQDRYLYLPSIAVVIFLVQAALSKLRPRFGMIAIGLVVMMLAGLTHNYAYTYASDRAVRLRNVEVNPRWSEAQFELGYQCWLEKDLDCTARHYRKALEADPKNSQALVNMGAILIEQGDYRQAKSLLEKALTVAPDAALIYHNLAVIATQTGEEKEKIPEWNKKYEEMKSLEKKKDYRLGAFRVAP
jgi:tetratricopeptide (TPR) repeat protein